ncbi:catalytic domain of components of various dehydrogenase complexes [Candidatus Moduliflexus flocculans]|uniref:Dihydrolipoamide acetyltransferase component of pyruvate dehydrogenase complex n=1 Tax=Candidatus Moduliflexus flocculans TaxID=1499966 RepID=A0A0S6VTC7_9BACT|nr:catalytic domain of components of various dehydrogenase complexes [Candidatus Moduliflexus flocculans]
MAEKILMLSLSPTMEVGTIAKWNYQEGNEVKAGSVLCEIETDKAVMDYEIPQGGVLLKIIVPQGSEAKVGAPIAILGKPGEDISALLKEEMVSAASAAPEKKTETAPTVQAAPAPTVAPSGDERIKSSPLARKIAQEAGIELGAITGTGPGGRIIKRDIEQAKQTPPVQPAVAPAAPVFVAPSSADETIRVSQKRKVIAQRLAESKFSAPHFYLKITVNMDGILAARTALNATLKEKVSLNAFLVKFVAEALKKHPTINSTWQGDTILKHGSADIGLAVAQPDGLVTPVVKNCGNKGIVQIDDELRVLIQKAQNNRLEPQEYTGATFTISSLGSYGIEEFTAIINPPGSAILAVGAIRKEPVVTENDDITIQSNMALTLSCDHRVIDGAVGAAFLADLKKMLEQPIRALF